MTTEFIIERIEGLEERLLMECCRLDVGLEDQQMFSCLTVDVAEGRSHIETLYAILVPQQRSDESKYRAQQVCEFMVDEFRSLIASVRKDTGVIGGSFFFDRWTPHGDIQLAIHSTS